jgi:hypothetical protein
MNLPFLFLNLVLLALGPALAGAGSLFKIYVEYDGVYRVDHADFNQPDLTLDSTRLLLNNRGQEVPIHVEDGGDGVFDSGDYFIFRGQHLAGDTSWFNEFSKYNVYRLRLDRKPGLRLKPAELVQLGNKSNAGTVYVTRHLEHENTRVTLPGADDQSKTESWYWKRLSHLDSRPFMHSPEERPIGIRIALTGMSQDQNATKSGLAQHKVDI